MAEQISDNPMPRLQQSPSYESLLFKRPGTEAFARSGFPQQQLQPQTHSQQQVGEKEGRFLKRGNSDSDIVPASKASNWSCRLCSYENVDPTKERCALCGSLRYTILPPLTASSDDITASRTISQGMESPPRSGPTSTTVSSPVTNLDTQSGWAMPREEDLSGFARTPNRQISSSATSQQSDNIISSDSDQLSEPDFLATFKKTADLISIQLLDLAQSSGSSGNNGDSPPAPNRELDTFGASTATAIASNVNRGAQAQNQLDLASPTVSPAQGRDIRLSEVYRQGQAMIAGPVVDLENPSTYIPLEVQPEEDEVKEEELGNPEAIKEQALPTTMDVDEKEDSTSSRISLRCIRRCITILVVLLLVIILPITLTRRRNMNHTHAPTGAPTHPTTLSPTLSSQTVSPTAPTLPTSPSPTAPRPPHLGTPTSSPTQSTVAPSALLQTSSPTMAPTVSPSISPTVFPTTSPTAPPTTSPTAPPTTSPTAPPTTSPTMLLTESPSTTPTASPTALTNLPTVPTTIAPTSAPTLARTVTFATQKDFIGTVAGARFGSSIALSIDGSMFAALSLLGDNPIQVYSLEEDTGAWTALPSIPWERDSPRTFFGNSALDISVPRGDSGGVPTVAVASGSFVQVMQFVNGRWESKGQQSIAWVNAINSVQEEVQYSAISLSSDGSLLAMGSITLDRALIIVRVFEFDETNNRWVRQGRNILRWVNEGTQFETLSLSLSGNGEVLAISDWRIDRPAVQVETYERKEGSKRWTSISVVDELSFPWGPSALALSEEGSHLAVSIPTPGATRVYERSDSNGWLPIGEDLVGGSAVSITQDGSRVLIGQQLSGIASVFDFENGSWVSKDTFGTETDQFGSSVSMSGNGNILAIGAPLEDIEGINAGVDNVGSVRIFS